jgi:hypothetical protein
MFALAVLRRHDLSVAPVLKQVLVQVLFFSANDFGSSDIGILAPFIWTHALVLGYQTTEESDCTSSGDLPSNTGCWKHPKLRHSRLRVPAASV